MARKTGMTTRDKPTAELRALQKAESKVWFWRPSWYWFGWGTLVPIYVGHDDFARRTLLLGWSVTGRVIIALWPCGEKDCYDDTLDWDKYMRSVSNEMDAK